MAVQSSWIWDESYICSTGTTLANSQFGIVALSTALTTGASGLPTIVICAGVSNGVNGAIGVLQDTPAVGRAGLVRHLGISKVLATTSAAVTFGSLLTCTTGGAAMVADTTGQLVIGRCVSASTTLVSGALAEVLMTGPWVMSLL